MGGRADILSRSDAGESADAIAQALAVSISTVYTVLREHRPGRKRKPRRRTGVKRLQLIELLRLGTEPSIAADMIGCSKAYAYVVAGDQPGR